MAPINQVVPIDDFNATGDGLALFSGDRLKFECRTDKWGIDGGIDEVRLGANQPRYTPHARNTLLRDVIKF